MAYKSDTTKHTRIYKNNIEHDKYKDTKLILLNKLFYTLCKYDYSMEELSNILVFSNNCGNNTNGNNNNKK